MQEAQSYGWFPLTMCMDYEFCTYEHPKGGQSAIDTIIVSDSLKEMVSPLDCLQIFDKGHKLIYTNFLSSYKNVPTWETSYAGNPVFEIDNSSKWQTALENFLDNSHHTSIDSDWSLWCHTFQKLHNSNGSVIGDTPSFRIRDVYRKNKLLSRLSKAIQEQDWLAHDNVLKKLKHIAFNQLRKWQKRMNPRGQLSHDWSRHLFKWAKDPQPPIPSCIASNHFGCNGFTTSLHESLCEISHYFPSVYRSDAEQQAMEVPPGDTHYTCDEFERIFAMTKQVIAKANTSRVSGLDGLEVAYLKQLPEEAIKFIAHIFAKALSTHRVPQAWLNCKMSCIPKKPGKSAVKDLRPLTIAPVIYRTFCKVILVSDSDKQQNIPQNSVGGVLHRSAHQAWLPAALKCEATWKLPVHLRKTIQGVAIDTEKFFDNVPPDKACEALRAIGLPTDSIATWQYMIKHIKRFPSLNGAIHAESFSATLGIPQGDPLSMLAAAALLGQWTTQMPQDDLFNKVFVDDRLMLSNSDHALLDAFHATELWDERMGFTTKAKTCAFGSNAEVSKVWWMDATEVSRCKLVTYLGVPLPLYGISAFDFYNPIIQKALNTLNRICRAKLTNENATAIISRKILPALCYPATVVRPTKAQISTLRSKFFAAAAQRPCQTMLAHTLFCEKTHQFDPESALIYHNLRFWRRVFLGDPKLRDEFLHLLEDALPCKPVLYGPINIFQKDIDWLGCIFNPSNAEILHPSLGTLSLYDPDKRGFEHKLRSFIRHTLASALQDKHVKWEGVVDVDIGTTTAFLRSLDPD